MITSVKERHQSRRSSFRGGTMTHTREWLVTCSDPTDGTPVAVSAVPQPGERHPTDPSATVSGIEAQPHENSDRMFLVQVEYTTGTFGLPTNPLNNPPEISYGYTEGNEPYFKDYSTPDKKRTTNTAGDPFETFLERETGELTLTITVNEQSFNPVAMDAFKHTTNQDAVTIDGTTYAENTLKLSPPSATKVTEVVQGQGGASEKFTYYKVSYVLRARTETWDDKVLDMGLNELIPDKDPKKPGKLRPIVDSVNVPIKKPWPLSKGKKKPAVTDDPDELVFKPYKPTGWGGLKPFQPGTWAKA